MDRQGWIAVILCVAGLFLWQWYVSTNYPPQPVSSPGTEEQPPGTAVTQPAAAQAAPQPAPSPTPTPAPEPLISARQETITTRNSEFVFSNDAGGIERAVLLMHLGEQQQAVFLNGSRALPIGAVGFEAGKIVGGFDMSVDREARTASFRKREADGLVVQKVFTAPADDAKNPHLLRLRVEFSNAGAQPVSRPAWFVSAGGAAPVHAHDMPFYTKFSWMHGGKVSSIDVNWFNPGGISWLGVQWRGARPLFFEQREQALWAAVASQYFCTIVTAERPSGNSAWATRFDARKLNDSPVYGIQGALGMPGFSLAPGESLAGNFTIYAGPKVLDLLRSQRGGQDAVLNFGMFGFISEILLWAMNSLHAVTGSFALAIILLTLIIKTLLWPVQNKATNEMRKMAALSPKMTELREKYKDDPQKLNEEMMKMYREYGVNPFSGCLPMLIQIPIFFGFYAMLGSAIELRNSSFLWVRDLSQPDTIGHFLGFPINLLPIVMAGTMVWQMVITPKSGDKVQQRIFYFMPATFLVFCYT
ncbi:MAG: membrane protein insertase YidC, partial [Terrimicrobiaceae bacterium]|nr:membrane protein insertase YidC [Terrimicrobiaceae bacterium]